MKKKREEIRWRRRKRPSKFFFSSPSAAGAGPGRRVFLSAAQPTDQGMEGVVFLLVVVVGTAGHVSFPLLKYSVSGCEQ